MSRFLRPRKIAHVYLALAMLFGIAAQCQDDTDSTKPVPILTGSTAFFTRVNGGQASDAPSVTPVLLAPFGDKWLVEVKGNYTDTFSKGGDGSYGNTSSYGLVYAQVDYIASRYVTVTGGRFITPFGIYGERLAPNWIKALQVTPVAFSITSSSALGGMLRGGFPVGSQEVNLNYAFYFSSNNTNHIVATNRSTGGRVGFFLPGPRLEIGASFQQLLQGGRSHAFGLHAEWQPNRLPLTLRSEYAHSSGMNGSGYWIESVYRLSKVPYLRRLELAGRGQQFFADPKLTDAQSDALGALGYSSRQGDVGLNYYLGRDVRASASYGRQFSEENTANIWVVGISYRFIMPLGFKGGAL
jgi:hypothetical protein